MGESTGGSDASMAMPVAKRNTVASAGESSDGADTTRGTGTVDGEVNAPNTGKTSQVNFLHTFDCFIHHLYLI